MIKTAVSGFKWLDRPAALSWFRMIRDGCPPEITSAGRTYEEQQDLRDRYLDGSGNFAWPPDDPRANHVGGRAVDLPLAGRTWMRNAGAGGSLERPVYNAYGWSGVANEPWHFNYSPEHDQHAQEDDMDLNDKVALTKTTRDLLREHNGGDLTETTVNNALSYTIASLYMNGSMSRRLDAMAEQIKALTTPPAAQIDYDRLAEAVANKLAQRMAE